MRALVTGATGYIGREVVRQLLERGDEAIGLARRHSELDIPFVQADLTDADGLARALDGQRFDCVLHAGSLPGDTGDPGQMLQVNLVGCQNMLEFARRSEVSRFVLTSSISAYEWYPATKFSPPDYLPVDEKHPCRPRDIYSTSKRMQELLALTYFHQYELATTTLRLTAVVGPRGSGGGRGWRDFAEQLHGGERVQIPHFSGDELCHYVDLRDVGRMHLMAAEHYGAVGEIFNCCGSNPTRGSEIADIVQRLIPGVEVDYGYPWSMAQGGEVAFDMSKAKALMDYAPRYSMADSIGSIKDWIDGGGLGESERNSAESFGSGVSE